MEFFNVANIHLYLAIVLSVLNGILMCFASSKLLQIIQLSGYKVAGYQSWIKDTKANHIVRFFTLSFLSLAAVLVTNAFLDAVGDFYSYIGLFFYFYFTIVFILNVFKVKQKTPLVQTKRMNRLIATLFFLSSGITFILIAVLSEYLPEVKFGIIAITPALMPILVPLAHLINVPMENIIRRFYIKKAKIKLNKQQDLIKIGITGSYGKTTTKYILNAMLSAKYNVCMSPHSFNTPMGLTKVVLKYLKPEHNVLIAEMGARHIGDIKYLCDLIKPQHAIITAVGNQHLATFGSVENIAKTKNELVDAVTDGDIIFNLQSEGATKLYNKCNKNKYTAGIENSNAYANITNIKSTINGSEFTLTINGESIDCRTKLLGYASLQDIALASALGYRLGLSLQDIKATLLTLKPLSHRLELINKNGITIIDNSYNSSVESAYSTIDMLKDFEGNKIIVTPGLVELGSEERIENEKLGEHIATVFNKVFIINKANLDAIKLGLLKHNFPEENIMTYQSLEEAKEKIYSIAKKGDIVLFQNDLPDNYI